MHAHTRMADSRLTRSAYCPAPQRASAARHSAPAVARCAVTVRHVTTGTWRGRYGAYYGGCSAYEVRSGSSIRGVSTGHSVAKA
eukprot:3940897-Rhodomonas_salina.2